MSNVGFGLQTFVQPTVNYGSDFDCVTDLTPSMSETSGLHLLAEALMRRLITPRGTLIDDQNYGFDLRREIDDDVNAAGVARIQTQIDAELRKDERVKDSQTTAALANNVLTISTIITPSAGPTFTLVAAVTQITAALLAPTF